MDAIDVLAVIGSCAPERQRYALKLADATHRDLIPSRRLSASWNPVAEAASLAPWCTAAAGATLEFPSDVRPTEIIGALSAADGATRLSGVVCVADAAHLLDDLRRDSYAARRLPDPVVGGTEYLAHAMLTVTQLEFASTVVLVNWDVLSTPDLSTVLALVSHLSPQARLRLDRDPFEPPETGDAYAAEQERPGWVAVLNDEHSPHMTDPRVTTLRYEQFRPFHPARLQRVLDERVEPGEFGSVVRSAGFCRLATRPHVTGRWDHVGRMISFEPLGIDARLEASDEVLAFGQDLAITGVDLDVAGLRAAFDSAALDDDELAAGPEAWAAFEDPFPAWLTAPQNE